ncbi:MAG: S-adenosylmethionine:tRNA ribosyltransferase-isomerase [Bacteroidetes bacterium]|nr:S-adenosylmethionine:tRNA ribosyltransferase-isomerase [Bacteroidota bacterium]
MSFFDVEIKDFDYDLPDEKIAKFPLEQRDQSKLLIYKNQQITQTTFSNLSAVLPKNSMLVFNNTKVVQARLIFKTSSNHTIEIFCLESPPYYNDISSAMSKTANIKWHCLVGNLKKWKEPSLTLAAKNIELKASIIQRSINFIEIEFNWSNNNLTFAEVLEKLGSLPIPPYLKREATVKDDNSYQTIYAQHKGSVAAPTAGLHFTEKVFQDLKQNKITTGYVTLHVGAGTFKPVKANNINEHEMHAEWLEADFKFIESLLNFTPIIAVGTTSLRTLETLYWMGVKAILNSTFDINALKITQWEAYQLPQQYTLNESLNALLYWMKKNNVLKIMCQTQILILPGYKLRVAKAIITNFHQPKSTLLLLVSAVVGSNWKKIYQFALEHNYRFLSYGDSSILFANEVL